MYPAKNNVDDGDSILDILREFYINEDDYYNALGISKDNDYELHLVRIPNSCFVNNYFKSGLLAWQANMDIKPVNTMNTMLVHTCVLIFQNPKMNVL